jgi:hypothetical protein
MKQPGKFLKSRPNYSQAKYVSRTAAAKQYELLWLCLRAGPQAFHRKMRIQFTALNGAEYNSQITGRSFESNLQPHDVFLGSKNQSTGTEQLQVGAACLLQSGLHPLFSFSGINKREGIYSKCLDFHAHHERPDSITTVLGSAFAGGARCSVCDD